MIAMLSTLLAIALAVAAEKTAIVVAGTDPPVRISRATVLTPADGPPVALFAAVNETDRAIDTLP